MSYKIRKAELKDVERLADIRMRLFAEVGELISDDEFEAVKAANKTYFEKAMLYHEFVAYVAEVNDHIVGTSGLVLFQRPPYAGNLSGLEAYIMNMFTEPEWREKGIASLLLDYCIEYCKNHGVGRIWLHASPDGRPLYIKKGFKEKSSEMELFL
jgi:GNAT superfamily N-acetyltransferase